MVDSIINFLNQGWVGVSIGIIVAFISIKHSNKKPIPVYQKHSFNILKKDELELSSNIHIFYNEREVDNLTKTQIIFWNNGSDTLKIEDVVEDDKLLLKFSEHSTILSSKIIKKSRDINKSYIRTSTTNKNITYFGFDYLDENDGMTFEIVHTDLSPYPEVHGTFKGIPQGIQDLGKVDMRKTICNNIIQCISKDIKLQLIIMSVLGLFILIIGLYPHLLEKMNNINKTINDIVISSEYMNIFLIILGFMYLIIPLIILIFNRKRFPKSLIINEE